MISIKCLLDSLPDFLGQLCDPILRLLPLVVLVIAAAFVGSVVAAAVVGSVVAAAVALMAAALLSDIFFTAVATVIAIVVADPPKNGWQVWALHDPEAGPLNILTLH